MDNSRATAYQSARIAERMFKNGADVIQLRYKNMPSYELIRIAKKINAIARKYGKKVLINDRADVTRAVGCAGIHLGSADMSPRTVKRLLGKPRAIVGKTVHSISEAKKYANEPVDYLSAGPIFRTPIKKNLSPHGPGFVTRIKKSTLSAFPVVAIGGINERNVRSVLKGGADGVCVTRSARRAEKITEKISEYFSQEKK
ncbi:MAG: thiamine phosphate synthase [Candidatus Omnitrophica bacterium]|nr:thiamine phosphate synthase [Candidatus Omnitrophota bacterium]